MQPLQNGRLKGVASKSGEKLARQDLHCVPGWQSCPELTFGDIRATWSNSLHPKIKVDGPRRRRRRRRRTGGGGFDTEELGMAQSSLHMAYVHLHSTWQGVLWIKTESRRVMPYEWSFVVFWDLNGFDQSCVYNTQGIFQRDVLANNKKDVDTL